MTWKGSTCQASECKLEKSIFDTKLFNDKNIPSSWVKRVSPEKSVPLHVQITRDESFRVIMMFVMPFMCSYVPR